MQAAILTKIARNCRQLGLTVNSETSTAVVIENGTNDLTISLVAADIMKPMGGVDNAVSPFIGIGVVNPVTIKVKSATTGATPGIADIVDSAVSAKVLKMLGAFANDVTLENLAGSYTLTMRGHPDMIGVGQ